jgi:hypothetical protein
MRAGGEDGGYYREARAHTRAGPHKYPGTIYLLHFDTPYQHAKHYTGWTAGELEVRLAEHARGSGARLLSVIGAAGIGWRLARTWEGGRSRERALKRQGGASRRCPLCGVKARARVTSGA